MSHILRFACMRSQLVYRVQQSTDKLMKLAREKFKLTQEQHISPENGGTPQELRSLYSYSVLLQCKKCRTVVACFTYQTYSQLRGLKKSEFKQLLKDSHSAQPSKNLSLSALINNFQRTSTLHPPLLSSLLDDFILIPHSSLYHDGLKLDTHAAVPAPILSSKGYLLKYKCLQCDKTLAYVPQQADQIQVYFKRKKVTVVDQLEERASIKPSIYNDIRTASDQIKVAQGVNTLILQQILQVYERTTDEAEYHLKDQKNQLIEMQFNMM